MVPRRTLVPALALVLLAVPVLASSPPGTYSDPAGDQSAHGLIALLEDAGRRCHDPAFDVVAANVTLDADEVTVRITFDDVAATPACGDLGYTIEERLGVVHLYFDYEYVPATGYTGHYVAWQHDVDGTLCTSVHSVHGSSGGCVGGIGDAGSLLGDTLTWTLPRSGTFVASGGGTVAYDLQEPLRFYGRTYSYGHASVDVADAAGGWLEDGYAW